MSRRKDLLLFSLSSFLFLPFLLFTFPRVAQATSTLLFKIPSYCVALAVLALTVQTMPAFNSVTHQLMLLSAGIKGVCYRVCLFQDPGNKPCASYMLGKHSTN